MLCRERAAQLRSREAEFAAAGAKLLFVGSGTPAMAADFASTHAGAHPVLSDVHRRCFEAAGMRRSIGAMLHWRMWKNVWRALRSGFRQARVQGDPWQQGGVLVLDSDARLRHQQADRAGGDEIDVDAVLRVVTSA
ncbi:MAG: AhpC/TSA family protein [Planctomycetota bacterium]